MYNCPNCGKKIEADHSFCPACGAEVKSSKFKNKKDTVDDIKTLKPKSVLFIVGSIFFASLLMLVFSGILSKPGITEMPGKSSDASGSTVDLSALNKINQLEASLKENPGNYENILQLAHLQNDSRLYAKAIKNYKKYLDKYPENADARIDMGVCYYNLGEYDTAISEMKQALKYSPDHQIAHLNLGIVNLTAGNIQKSEEWLRKAININPNSDVGKRAKELLELYKLNDKNNGGN